MISTESPRKLDVLFFFCLFYHADECACVPAVWQAFAGEAPNLLSGLAVREAAVSDPVQSSGSGLHPNCVVGWSLLLPPAAYDRSSQPVGDILHPKGSRPKQEIRMIK